MELERVRQSTAKVGANRLGAQHMSIDHVKIK